MTAGEKVTVGQQTLQELRGLARQSDQNAALACIDAFARTDFRADLLSVNVPALVIHGDADAIVPMRASGRRTSEKIAAPLYVIKGAPHGANASHSQEFNAALASFVESL